VAVKASVVPEVSVVLAAEVAVLDSAVASSFAGALVMLWLLHRLIMVLGHFSNLPFLSTA